MNSNLEEARNAYQAAQLKIAEAEQALNSQQEGAEEALQKAKTELDAADRDVKFFELQSQFEEANQRLKQQQSTITQLSTTNRTIEKRQADLASGKWDQQLKTIREAADEDPAQAAKELANLLPQMMSDVENAATQKALNDAQNFYNNLRYIDSVRQKHSDLAEAGYENFVQSRASVLMDSGVEFHAAIDQAVKEAKDHLGKVKAGTPTPPVPPPVGSISMAGSGGQPPVIEPQTVPSDKDQLRQRRREQDKKVL